MQVQIGTIIAIGGTLFLWVVALSLVGNQAACNGFDVSNMSPPIKFLTKFAYLCWVF